MQPHADAFEQRALPRMQCPVGERRVQEDLDEHRDEVGAVATFAAELVEDLLDREAVLLPSRKSRSASRRWAPVSCISSITRAASRISSRVTWPSAFARWPITEKVAVKNAVWVRSRESRRSGSPRPAPRSAVAGRSKLCPSAMPASAPSGPPSAKPTAPPRIFPSQLMVRGGPSGWGSMGRDYIGSRRSGQRRPGGPKVSPPGSQAGADARGRRSREDPLPSFGASKGGCGAGGCRSSTVMGVPLTM